MVGALRRILWLLGSLAVLGGGTLSGCSAGSILTPAEEARKPDAAVTTTIDPDCVPAEEVCNNLDDDCDGLVDEYLVNGFCYPADPETAIYYPCRAGILRCNRGKWSCEGAIVPEPETCNNLDDDCNGIPDDIPGRWRATVDLLLIVDRSGSASFYVNDLLMTRLPEMLYTLARQGYRIWLIDMPNMAGGAYGPHNMCPQASPYPDCAYYAPEAINSIQLAHPGEEQSYAVLMSLARDGLHIDWTPNARRTVIAFFDEPDHSFHDITKGEVASALAWSPYDVIIYTNPRASYDYEGIGAEVKDISELDTDWLIRRITEPAQCGP